MKFCLRIIILIFFSLASCNYKKYKDTINAEKGTYWDVIKLQNKEFKEPKYSYFFGVNGECKLYSFQSSHDGTISRVFVETGKNHTWKMMTDTFEILGAPYLLRSNKNKMLLLTGLNYPTDTLELIESGIK